MCDLRQMILRAAVDAGRIIQAHKIVNEKIFHVRVALQLRQHPEGLRL